jgi:hypothetical protein
MKSQYQIMETGLRPEVMKKYDELLPSPPILRDRLAESHIRSMRLARRNSG